MSGMDRLDESVWALLHEALRVYQDSPRATLHLRHQLARFEQPVRIAVAGPWQSGKSTLINAILGEEVAPVEVGDGRQTVTWYEDGPAPRATAYSAGGVVQELPVTRSTRGMRVELSGPRPDHVTEIVVKWPSRTLRHMTLVDTPALPAGAGDDGRADGGDGILDDADAVLYLTRDARDSDLRFLHRAQEGAVANAAPVNVLLVLSRADEVGGGRVDALLTARQLARRHRRDPRVGALCVSVLALGGLVALAGRVLIDGDFGALAVLAAMPRADLEPYLLSTDRFVGPAFPASLDAGLRRGLLERFGLFGVRLATTLIRAGFDSRPKLSAELVRRSGLTELREALGRYFVDRAEVLKARSALAALERVLRAEPRQGSAQLSARLEQILASAHDFRELRLLAALADAQLSLDAELSAEAVRLIGGNGTALAARLGIDYQASIGELWELGADALGRWQDHSEDPLLNLDQRRAAQVIVRSCEGMLAELAGGYPPSRVQ
ncbi:Dynamin family protein [Micromonospora pattaloongensis]|uniref:Dynamin family protein n=1 Tax=Micromonospora pattaloongensis TaxID=405436 RepID=A0A1H3SVH9_9ACTN|nr:dynamin family protein [Micromonospora pattaloongensis]SDZ41717.1 Dynamin family protein [Micromonospora pattaloongensis]